MTLTFENPDNAGVRFHLGKCFHIRTSIRLKAVFTAMTDRVSDRSGSDLIPACQKGGKNLRHRCSPRCGLSTLSCLTPRSPSDFSRRPLSKQAAAGHSSALMTRPQTGCPATNEVVCAPDFCASDSLKISSVPAGQRSDFCHSSFELWVDGQARTPARFDCHPPLGTATCF